MPSAKISPCCHNSIDKNKCQTPTKDRVQEQYRIPLERQQGLTPFQKFLWKLHNDELWQRDIALGRRIAFYKFRGELGTGNFSQVKSAIHCLTHERVAVKILDKSKLDKKTQKMLSREIISMESLHHAHIIRLFEVIENMSKIYLVMEHASGGELFHKISNDGKFTEQDAKSIFAQITDAVDHMHTHNIIHRDLKAENVFFSAPGHVKVGDFGFSTQVKARFEPLRTFCGSPPYAAPELFQDDSYVGPAVDIWALGVLLYFMLTATMPFKSQTVSGLKKLITDGHFNIPDYLSADCQWLIYGLLRRSPNTRHSMDQIKKSKWLSGQTLPDSPPKYSFQPPSVDEQPKYLSKEELAAQIKLKELGVTEVMVEDAWERGVKSNVTGTYRIILHYLTNPTIKEDTISTSSEHSNSCSSLLRSKLSNRINSIQPNVPKNKKSLTCIII